MIARTLIQSPNFLEVIPKENLGLNKKPPDTHPQKLIARSDDELCRNAQQGCAVSREMLWDRYRDYILRMVHKENKRQYLPRHETADALQELYFAFHRTVQRYDPKSHCKGKLASFKTFLRIVIAHRFSNYCTLWRIYHRRIALDFDDETSRSFTVGTMHEKGYSAAECEGLLPSEPSSDRLVDALRRLKPKERDLLEIWLQFGRDKEVAQILGISPAAAKLRRERLFRRIKKSVAGK